MLRRLYKYKGVEIIEDICALLCAHASKYPTKYSDSIFCYLEGKRSLIIFDTHANLKYRYGNEQFWAEGYYVSTVELNETIIKKFI